MFRVRRLQSVAIMDSDLDMDLGVMLVRRVDWFVFVMRRAVEEIGMNISRVCASHCLIANDSCLLLHVSSI